MKLPTLLVVISLSAACGAAEAPPDFVRETSARIAAWRVSLIEVRRCRPQSDVCATDLFVEHPAGDRTQVARGLNGAFLPLVKAKRVFACEYNSPMGAKAPLLLELDGIKTTLPDHPGYLRDCSVVGSGEEVLLIYSLVESDKPYSFVRVFNSEGMTLVEKRFDASGELEFSVAGKMFRVSVPTPDWPG